jgi:hypothetical protein
MMNDDLVVLDDNAIHDQLEHLLLDGKRRVLQRFADTCAEIVHSRQEA